MLGMHGNRAANIAVQECDLLICVGARFDDRATGKLDEFAPGARVIHMDADPSEIGKLRHANVPAVGDLRESLPQLPPAGASSPGRQRCAALRKRRACRATTRPARHLRAGHAAPVERTAPPDAIVACDVGQHQMWVAQHCIPPPPTAPDLAAPGHHGLRPAGGARRLPGLPGGASSGVRRRLDHDEHPGAGHAPPLRLPVKILLLDNSPLGMVRQWQELFFAERYSEIDLSDNPDFVEVAQSFGIRRMKESVAC
jgi:acetolactate synthase I/II/III large subunit